MICGIKPVKLSEAELAVCLQKLRVHNMVLKKLSQNFDLSETKFQEEFLSGRITIDLSLAEQEAIDSLTEKVKEDIMAHHIRSACAIAHHYCRKFNVEKAKTEEIVSEGAYALMKALCSYTKISIRFSTFSHWIVTNHLKDYFRIQHNGLSPVAKESLRLNNEIESRRLEDTNNVSFEQAAFSLGFDDSDIQRALEAKRSVRCVSGFSSDEDYNIINTVVVESEDELDCDSRLKQAFRDCPLSELERAVMDSAAEPYHGWKVEIGKIHRHDNGAVRGRQHIRMVLARAQKKVQNYYHALSMPKVA